MNACEVIARLHHHRIWVNQKLIAAVQPLTDRQLRQSLPIGQGSVWKTLAHLLAAEFVWLEALLGNEDPLFPGDVRGKLPGNQEGEGAFTTREELFTAWQQLEQRWRDYLSRLTEASLEEIVRKISTSSGQGKSHGTKRVDILLHVCTHAQYTTAQLVNMLRQLGQTQFPDVMMITLARQEQAANVPNP